MTNITEIKEQLSLLKQEAYIKQEQNTLPTKIESTIGFLNNCAVSLRFVLSEKENILFAVLSVVIISLVYFFGIQILDWIPEDIMADSSNNKDNILLDVIITIWSFLCVGIAAYPLGILTACMGASYLLRFTGNTSSIVECIKIAMPRAGTIGIFSWIDGWWTFVRILERLPKKNDRTPLTTKLRNEAIYQTWKAASLGFIPALICGRSLSEACQDSLSLLSKRFSILVKLRIGYSIICWIVGIGTYIGIHYLLFYLPLNHQIHPFYFVVGLPISIALIIIMVIFRPLYIIAACRIYAFYIREKNIPIRLPQPSSKIFSSLVAFGILVLIVGTLYLYRNELGEYLFPLIRNSK